MMDSTDGAEGEAPRQGEGSNEPWMRKIRVKKCGNRAQFTEGSGDCLPLSVKCGARC